MASSAALIVRLVAASAAASVGVPSAPTSIRETSSSRVSNSNGRERCSAMPPMMRRATDRTELNTVRPEMAGFRTLPNNEAIVEEFRDLKVLALVKLAVQRSGLKLEYLASKCSAK